MKTLTIYAAILFSIFSLNTSFAQSVKKETIKVWGNCGMCKSNIEKAAKSAGASQAHWNEDKKLLKVSYNANSTSGNKIQQAIADAGYDTQDFTASDASYNDLHKCCQYDRKSADPSFSKCCNHENCGQSIDCCKDMDCCKDKNCNVSKDGAMNCCDHTQCKKDMKACKETQCCKNESCCKS